MEMQLFVKMVDKVCCFVARVVFVFKQSFSSSIDAPNRMFLLRQAGAPRDNSLVHQQETEFRVEPILIHNAALFATYRDQPATAPFTKKTKVCCCD
jgi:hypothetical protein